MKWPAACVFSGLPAIVAAATIKVDAVLRAAECRMLQLNYFAPHSDDFSGYLTDAGDDIVIPSRFNRAAFRARPVFVYPVPLPSSPCAAATANTSGVVAVLHQWSRSLFDPANDHVLAVATGSGRGLAPLTVAVVPAAAAANYSSGDAAGLDWQSFVLSDGLYGQGEGDSHGGLGVRSTAAPGDGDEAELQRHCSEPRHPRALPPPLLANSVTYAGRRGRWVALPRDEISYSVAWYDGISPVTESYIPIDIVYTMARCS